MNNTSDTNDSQQRIVTAALDAFGGDMNTLFNAIKVEYARQYSRAKQRPEPTGEIVISVNNLTKTYSVGKTKLNALNGVSLDIHKGEFIALTGASGSGKSTLLQLIGGLDKPTAGSVEVNGHNLVKLNDKAISNFRNKTIGFVFQFFYLQPFLRLAQNLEIPGIPPKTKHTERRARVQELAELVGLSDRLKHYPRELSGGQMQRAAIARALLNNPQIILADEPTGNLDSANGKAIIELFQTIRAKYGTTIVVVTHDAQIAASADRELQLKDGVIL